MINYILIAYKWTKRQMSRLIRVRPRTAGFWRTRGNQRVSLTTATAKALPIQTGSISRCRRGLQLHFSDRVHVREWWCVLNEVHMYSEHLKDGQEYRVNLQGQLWNEGKVRRVTVTGWYRASLIMTWTVGTTMEWTDLRQVPLLERPLTSPHT